MRSVDVVSIHSPLYEATRRMFNERLLGTMRRGSYIVNTARGEETVPEAIAAALRSGQLAGYAGDVWYPQPPPADHPWRTMPNNAMTPHVSGTTLSAQARYAAGTREILESLVRRQAYPSGVPDRRGRQARRNGSPTPTRSRAQK